MPTEDRARIVDEAIRGRKTVKVLVSESLAVNTDRDAVDDLLGVAGWAPFHRPADKVHQRGGLGAMVPWRFHVLDGPACRRLREILLSRGDASKVPQMLGAAMALVQATWLPDPPKGDGAALFEPTLENMEHIAAASAAVENLLVAATARGIGSYWSSGGVLRQPEFRSLLDIPEREILLGSVYLFPADTGGSQVLPGKLREARGGPETWARWVTL